MCVALLYSVCMCVRVRETLLLIAFHVGLCFVLTLYKCDSLYFIHQETLCTPEGLISPMWKAVVALNCVFHARKHPDSSALLSQRESSSGRLGLPVGTCVPRGGCGVSWPWRQGLTCKFGGTALIRLLCLCCFSCGATLCSCFFPCVE